MIVTAADLRDVLHRLPNPDKEQGEYLQMHVFAQNLVAVDPEPSDSLTTESRTIVFRRRRRKDGRQGGRARFEWVLEL